VTIMREWLQTGQPMPVPGIAANSPGNHPVPRKPGQAASGHALADSPPGGDPHDASHFDRHLWQQTTRPAPFADMCTVSGTGPLASSIECHQGKATLQRLDQAAAANPSLASQLGARAPGGNPVRPADHSAPTGSDLGARNPGPAYLGDARPTPGGVNRAPGWTMGPTVTRRAPGE
jgi:hypothetical protein